MAEVNASALRASNNVSGKILQKETAKGVANLLVELFDWDAWRDPEFTNVESAGASSASVAPDPIDLLSKGDVPSLYKYADRIGSTWTDDKGSWTFPILNRDINLPGKNEQKPDLILLVMAPDEPGLDPGKRLIHFTRDIRYNAGTSEAYIIRLPTAVLDKFQIPVSVEEQDDRAKPVDRVTQYVEYQERTKAFDAGAAEYHGGQATLELANRKVFRASFLKSVGTDLAVAAPSGQVVGEGDSISEKNSTTINNGIARANDALASSSSQGVPVNLYFTPEDKQRLHTYFDNATGDSIEIPESDMGDILFRANSSDNPGTLLVHNNPIANFCINLTPDLTCAQEHTGLTDAPASPSGGTPEQPAGAITDSDIPTYIGRLVEQMVAPDVVLLPGGTAMPADQAKIQAAVNNFSLTKGPAEDPAFYDFNALQIAFDHVWKQLFDEAIPNLAYTANAIGQSRFGLQSILTSVKNGLLTINPGYTVAPAQLPASIARTFDITLDEFNEMSYTFRDQLVQIANAIVARTGTTVADMRVIQMLTEQGERLIDSVRQDDYYTLHKTLRDLQSRLAGKYEFTVFAADKDYHSVNFGLLTTYRQLWEPQAYQAGRLVKTIPLTPKEERKYSVKRTRNRKRSDKEAKKNSSSITNDQQSTARVEEEIAAKAQTKTSFNMSAEGDYDIGVSNGKGTTTFGVEALSESSQNRKDFREAVLKAAQEYKQETNTEITSEITTGFESDESGTIVNPNDELAVTYLFYELQKRYRLSEKIYRVMPVVLVAQEVPSPDQITPAWVLSNDWILNRSLLDASFRPTLAYIANKSVGDDFALRELRKNLRQQRNLVETLRIEFSAASMEADNRYKALETAIANRIDEEHREATDGFGSDLLQFFGGGGQDPQAAKARELAAKDAHDYAEQKAEKAAAALREEVSNLHALTDAYNKAVQLRLDNETKVERLLVHIRNNIFYYMQAIWSLEPPDQRFLRLYNVQVPVLELDSRSYKVMVATEQDIFSSFREAGTEKHKGFLHGKLKHNPDGSFPTKTLVEVADLDTLLGFKGNYMIFPLREHNALTEFMSAPYIDSAFGAMDPDELTNVSLDEYSKYVCCLHDKLSETDFEALKPQLKYWLEQLLASPLRNGDEIVVPTNSLFIEALVDQNSNLETFKLKHREVDVFKAIEESRRAGLENLRLAARLLNAERGDPEIDKKVLLQGISATTVSPDM